MGDHPDRDPYTRMRAVQYKGECFGQSMVTVAKISESIIQATIYASYAFEDAGACDSNQEDYRADYCIRTVLSFVDGLTSSVGTGLKAHAACLKVDGLKKEEEKW